MEQTIINEPKIRMNIKQNTKLQMYFDITVRGDSTKEVDTEMTELKWLAMIQCGQIIATAVSEDTKDASPHNSSIVIDEQPQDTKVMKE